MSEFLKQLDALRESLFEREEVKQYFALKRAIESDAHLMQTNAAMRYHQKQMASHLHDATVYAKEKALFEASANAYQTHPLVVNYEQAKASVYELLKQIKDILAK